MKKIIEGFSLLLLTFFSFFYTDKVINIINRKDPLLEKIISVKENYEVVPVNALIENDTIIPGINGKKIDINKSYNNMKIGGIFREDSLIFEDLYPNDRLYNNKNKYIIKGNNRKKNITIIVIYN